MGGFGIAILFSLFSFIYLFFVAIAIGIILYLLYSYVFQSIACMCMLKNIGYAYSLTAWIPFYHKYLLGKIANKQTNLRCYLRCSIIHFHLFMCSFLYTSRFWKCSTYYFNNQLHDYFNNWHYHCTPNIQNTYKICRYIHYIYSSIFRHIKTHILIYH